MPSVRSSSAQTFFRLHSFHLRILYAGRSRFSKDSDCVPDTQLRQICKLIKQADRNSAAFVRCRFEPCSADYRGMCADRAGSLSRKQVIRKGLRVRIPPSPLTDIFSCSSEFVMAPAGRAGAAWPVYGVETRGQR